MQTTRSPTKKCVKLTQYLKTRKQKNRFDSYACKHVDDSQAWKILIPPQKATEVKQALDDLQGNTTANLRMTMSEIESYLKNEFGVDIFNHTYPNNATILIRTLLRNDPEFYNKDREIVYCQISIYKQMHDTSKIEDYLTHRKINQDYFKQEEWEAHGWDGDECSF